MRSETPAPASAQNSGTESSSARSARRRGSTALRASFPRRSSPREGDADAAADIAVLDADAEGAVQGGGVGGAERDPPGQRRLAVISAEIGGARIELRLRHRDPAHRHRGGDTAISAL